MPEQNPTLSVEFITEESTGPDYSAQVEKSGGKVVKPQENWEVPPDLLDDYGDSQFEPFILIAATVSIGFLVKRVSDCILDHKRPGGQVVDTQGGKVVVRRAPHLARGTLVLQTDKGTEVYPPDKKDQALEVLKDLGLSLANG